MKPKHIAILKLAHRNAMLRCDHDVKGCKPGTMCACALLLQVLKTEEEMA